MKQPSLYYVADLIYSDVPFDAWQTLFSHWRIDMRLAEQQLCVKLE